MVDRITVIQAVILTLAYLFATILSTREKWMHGVPRGRKSFLVLGVSEINYVICQVLPMSIPLMFLLTNGPRGGNGRELGG
jgi:hypothetical protein